MKKMYFALMIIGLVLTSCGSGGSPSSRAKDLCDCLKEAGVEFDGINDLDDLEKIGDKMEKKKGQKCVLAVMEGVDEDISDMDDKETGEYLRDFLKAMIDTDCASEGMEEMEFGDMKKQLKKEIKRMKRRMKDGDDDDGYGYEDASVEARPDDYYDDYGAEQGEASSGQATDYEDYYDEYESADAVEEAMEESAADGDDDWD
ncbi:MAG: hypothetical protein HOH34_06770 [Flavobacteriales bacterium]|nr:hypothetical protein [Flavobacteriales bacterium]